MTLSLADIPRVSADITAQQFKRLYIDKQCPVVISKYAKRWKAYDKWSLDYIKEVAGEKEVPLYDDRPISSKYAFNQAHAYMTMSEYVELLQREPTKYRIFLWNILKEVPELQHDFDYPDVGIRLIKGLPMLFFGGQDSYTFMHYDIDLANIFHFHFHGKKKVILFDQEQNKYLYKVPFSLKTHEDIDFDNPDLDKWPLLSKAKGYSAHLEHGDMLYMPEGYWHYMKYITPGFSMSLRAVARHPARLTRAVYNVFGMRYFDNAMRSLAGQSWIDWRNNRALHK